MQFVGLLTLKHLAFLDYHLWVYGYKFLTSQ